MATAIIVSPLSAAAMDPDVVPVEMAPAAAVTVMAETVMFPASYVLETDPSFEPKAWALTVLATNTFPGRPRAAPVDNFVTVSASLVLKVVFVVAFIVVCALLTSVADTTDVA